MKMLAPLVVATTVGLGMWLVADASAGEPTDQIRAQIAQVYRTFQTAPPADRHAIVRPVIDEMFDWAEMAKRALGRHWQDRTAPEQAEFVRLFADLFEHAYLSKIELADADQFHYFGDTVEGGRAIVRTKITTRRGSEIPVDYMTRREAETRWKVYDLTTGGISLVGNYRTQFNAIVSRSSYPTLVEKLKAAGSGREP